MAVNLLCAWICVKLWQLSTVHGAYLFCSQQSWIVSFSETFSSTIFASCSSRSDIRILQPRHRQHRQYITNVSIFAEHDWHPESWLHSVHRHNCLKIKKQQDDKPGSSEALRIDQDSSAINTLGSRHLFQDVRDSFPHKVRHIETLEPWKPGNAPNAELHSSDPGSAPVPLQCPLPWQKKKNFRMLGGKENMQTLCLFHNMLQV